MKKIVLFCLMIGLNAQAAISELASYKDLDLSQIDKDTLVIFDIDNTLIRQNSMVGTHQWGDYIRDRGVRRGMDVKAASELQHKLFADLQSKVTVLPTENEVTVILKQLSERNIPHFALTARAPIIKDVTISQLQILGHDFSTSFPEQKDISQLDSFLKQGIIFSGSTPKGELLKLIIENSVRKPTHVIFIDDRSYNLESVEASLKDYPVKLNSYRYGGADASVKNFDPIEADLIYSFYVEAHELIDSDEAKSLIGSPNQIAELRHKLYLAKIGPLAQDVSDSCALDLDKQKSTCDYLFDKTPARIEYDYFFDNFSHSIYFGDW